MRYWYGKPKPSRWERFERWCNTEAATNLCCGLGCFGIVLAMWWMCALWFMGII